MNGSGGSPSLIIHPFHQSGSVVSLRQFTRLSLDNEGWIYSEPNPFNPPGNLQAAETQTYSVDLSSDEFPDTG